jgi:Spy/CpxP family protein refolding chaperone
MVGHRWAVLTVATLTLATGAARLAADEPKADTDRKHDRVEMLAKRLGLDDKQQEQIRKIREDYDKKTDPVEHQVWALHHEVHEAVHKVLNDDQRTKLAQALKEMRDKEFDTLADKIGLGADQKKKIAKIREEFEPKFHELAASREKGDNVHKQFRELRHQFLEAVRPELTEEQRAKLPVLMREEHHHWRNPAARHEHMKAVFDKLDLSADQKDQLKRIHAEYEPKIKDEVTQLRQLHHEEHEAMEKVLTPEQRTKWQDIRKQHRLDESPGDKK